MKKATLVLLILFFTLSCSKDTNSADPEPAKQEQSNNEDDGSSNDVSDDSSEQGSSKSIDLSEFPNLDLSNAEVLGANGSSDMEVDGSFKDTSGADEDEELPIVIIKGEDLLFGYFPDKISSDQITSLDILNFFVLMHPEVSVRGYPENDVIQYISSSPNKEQLLTLLKQSLNDNLSPFSNPEFVKLLNTDVQKTDIVYHLRRIKVNHPQRVKVSIAQRMKVNH